MENFISCNRTFLYLYRFFFLPFVNRRMVGCIQHRKGWHSKRMSEQERIGVYACVSVSGCMKKGAREWKRPRNIFMDIPQSERYYIRLVGHTIAAVSAPHKHTHLLAHSLTRSLSHSLSNFMKWTNQLDWIKHGIGPSHIHTQQTVGGNIDTVDSRMVSCRFSRVCDVIRIGWIFLEPNVFYSLALHLFSI